MGKYGSMMPQAIAYANVDIDLCRHMTLQGHNKLFAHRHPNISVD